MLYTNKVRRVSIGYSNGYLIIGSESKKEFSHFGFFFAFYIFPILG